MKQVFTAKTVDEAKGLAVAEFGAAMEKITFTVLEEPKKGLFGKLKGEAKVEAEYTPSKAEIAGEYIRGILKGMNIDADLVITETEDGAQIEITGDTTGAVIGRRGETLDAIQYLASMTANKSDREYYRINVDSCGYRDKRKAILEELALKISKTVLKTGRTSTLEPMNPYERRIIHSAISEIQGVSSRSIGEEPYRKVVISSDTPAKDRRDRSDRKPRGGKKDFNKERKNNDEVSPRSMDMLKTSFEKDYKKPKPEDDMIQGELYGKIDI